MRCKPTKTLVLKSSDKKTFVKSFNSNLPSEEFKKSCRKAGELFGERKKS